MPPKRAAPPAPPAEDLGATVRERRRGLGLTLEALAARSGVSRAMISDVERGAKSPTIKVARQLAAGLGTSLSDLVSGGQPGRRHVPAGERPTLVDPESGIVRQSLAPALLPRGVELLAFTFPPGSDSSSFPLHAAGTLKTVLVAEGELEAEGDGARRVLRKGDALTFGSDRPYLLRNASGRACVVHMAIVHPAPR